MSDEQLPVIDFRTVGPDEGRLMPDVVLPNQRGEVIDLHRSRAGRKALVVF